MEKEAINYISLIEAILRNVYKKLDNHPNKIKKVIAINNI